MSIVRLNRFRARAGKEAALLEKLRSGMVLLGDSPGRISMRILQSAEDSTRFTVIEEWESVEAHRASLQRIPFLAIAETLPLLDGKLEGEYYTPA